MARIVSLIASATEIIHALGFGEQIVGRSHECDYPASVKALPSVTAPKFRIDGTSYDIDQRVKEILSEALSVYRVDAEQLASLRPTHIVTQTQCEVCAVSLKDVEAAASCFVSSRPAIVSLSPHSLADIMDDIVRVAAGLGAPGKGKALVDALTKSMAELEARARALRDCPSVACIEWIDPLMSAGNWMPELVEKANGRNLFGVAGHHSPGLTVAELVAADPEVIIVSPCGFDIERTLSELPAFKDQLGGAGLRAVSEGRLFVADGNQFFNRPGPRLVESLEILTEILHPAEFDFGHRGSGWVQLSL